MPLIDYEREVFAECGAWKNFWDLEESLSLDELMELFDISIERQNRVMRMMAAAMGADIDEPEPRRDRDFDNDKSHYRPAFAVDPTKGGEARPLFGEEDVLSLPINLGYGIIEADEV